MNCIPRSHRTRLKLSLFAIVTVATWLIACKSGNDITPLRYTHVETMHRADSNLVDPFGIAVKDRFVFITDGGTGSLHRIDPDGASEVFATGLNTPSAIAFLPDGDLVVADTGSHTIKRVTSDGAITTLAGVERVSGKTDGPAFAATFNAPIGIATSDNGDVFVADTYNDRIRLIRNGEVSTLAGSDRGFADGSTSRAKFDTPLGIAVWNNTVLVADSGNARIRVVEPNGDVLTLAGNDRRDLLDGPLAAATFVAPTAVATDGRGNIFVADGNAIRVIGSRVFPSVKTLAGNRRGFADGRPAAAEFNRPSGLVVSASGELYVADSDNQRVRIVSVKPFVDPGHETHPPLTVAESQSELASRWPFDPPSNPREVAGTLGEIRGEIGPENKPVWFHNGLDIAGAYGETAMFLRDETVLDPGAADNFGTSRELLRMPLLGYIHLRLGRDKDDRPFVDPRFQFDRDASGKLTGIRVPRGTRFMAGEAIGTLNAMNHVHLIAGVSGREKNAFEKIRLPGVSDSITPVIENVALFTTDWREIKPEAARYKLSDKTRIVVRAYDRMDGNSERRRLGVYRVGYQVHSNGAPLSEIEWPIRFDWTPSNDCVRFVYAYGSRSGYTADTVFNYIATNRVLGDTCSDDFLDVTKLARGSYTLRVFAADYFGNTASKDVDIEVSKP